MSYTKYIQDFPLLTLNLEFCYSISRKFQQTGSLDSACSLQKVQRKMCIILLGCKI